LQKQEEKLGTFTSSPYVYHTEAMTALVEYGIKCFIRPLIFSLS